MLVELDIPASVESQEAVNTLTGRLHKQLCKFLPTRMLPIDLSVSTWGGGTVNWPCPSVADAIEVVTVFNLLTAVHSYHFFSEVVSFNSFPLATQV